MYGKDEYEECKVGAVHLTMEDMVRIPFERLYETENAEEKVRKDFWWTIQKQV